MTDVDGNALIAQVREILRLGNVYAANKEWGSAMTMFRQALDVLYSRCYPADRKPQRVSAQPAEGSSLFFDKTEPLTSKQMTNGEIARFLELFKPSQNEEFKAAWDSFYCKNDGWLSVFPFSKDGLDDKETSVWTIVFHKRCIEKYDDKDDENQEKCTAQASEFVISHPMGDSTSFIVTHDCVKALPTTDTCRLLMAYAWAHLGEASAAKLSDMYRQHQILDGAAIPALMEAERFYEQALLLKSGHAWTLAHRGELHRDVANCILNQAREIHCRKDRLRSYAKSIVYFRWAICAYRCSSNSTGTQSREYAWACAHLGAAVVNARAFVGLTQTSILLTDLIAKWDMDCPIDSGRGSAVDSEATKSFHSAVPLIERVKKEKETTLKYLDKAMKMLVLALKTEGFYYPWAHSYYSGSLLLKGALDIKPGTATEVAALGQVTSSNAYYLDPRLLENVFEPNQLAVNPTFELALVHYSKVVAYLEKKEPAQEQQAVEDCRRAWSYAWISMKWLFKYHFQEGLQGLAICRLLEQIAIAYIRKLKPEASPKPTNLIHEAMLDQVDIEPCQSHLPQIMPPLFDIPQRPIDSEEGLVEFIDRSVTWFASWQLRFLLKNEVKLNSNITTGLILTKAILQGFLDDMKGNSDDSDAQNKRVETRGRLGSLQESISCKLKGTESSRDLIDEPSLLATLFSLLTAEVASIDKIRVVYNTF